MLQKITTIVIGLVLTNLVSVTHAIPVNFSIQGTVENASAMNIFGLSVGDSIFANATFDDSLIASGDVEFGTDGNAFGSPLTFTVGSQTFVESDDEDFIGGSFPLLEFNAGLFSDFDFLSDLFDAEEGLEFVGRNAADDEIGSINGTFDASTASISPVVASVPEPSSMLLMGLGILGLVGAKKKLVA